MERKCLFCKIAAGSLAAKIIYEDEEVMAFNDINPRAKVHILLIPKKHIPSVAAINKRDRALIGKIVLCARDIACRAGLKEGFRLVSNSGSDSGQIIDHLHFHLLGGQPLGPIS